LFGVFTFGVVGVGVAVVLPGRGWDGIRGGSRVFVFKVGLYCVDDGLGLDVFSFVIGSRTVARLGWSLVRSSRPAAVFWLLW